MNPWQKDIHLNHQRYSTSEIIEFSTQKINETIPEWEKEIYQFLMSWYNGEQTIQVSTSGSTGTPKIILLEKVKMINSAVATGKALKLKKEDTALLCLPAKYIAGKMMIVRAIELGLSLFYIEPKSQISFTTEYHFCAMTPMQVKKSLNSIPNIKTLIIGGGKTDYALINALKKTNTTCYATYGMTETISHIALQKLTGTDASDSFHALPGVQLNQDQRNCLTIHAPSITDDIITTNDIVEFEDFNQFIWKGRFDHVINSGGVKISPEQVEKKLEDLLDCRYIISSLPDELLENKVILILERTAFDPTTLALFKSHLEDTLSKIERPKEIFFVDQLIETETQKINRKKSVELVY